MQIPYVRSGDKLHVTANTINTIVNKVNGAPTISAGKPIKGGGGGGGVPVVQDNTADIFKIKKSTHDYDIDVSGGNVILGSDVLQCLGSIFIVSFQYSSDTAGTQYVVLTVSYNSQNNTYNAELSLKYSPAYPNNLYNFQYTIGKVDFVKENNAAKISNIEQWHYPNHIIITDRWS